MGTHFSCAFPPAFCQLLAFNLQAACQRGRCGDLGNFILIREMHPYVSVCSLKGKNCKLLKTEGRQFHALARDSEEQEDMRAEFHRCDPTFSCNGPERCVPPPVPRYGKRRSNLEQAAQPSRRASI